MARQLLESGRQDGQPLATNSVKLAHRVLHRALADAVRWNLIVVNPASGVRVPKGTTKAMKVWTAEDAKRFLDALADDRLVGCGRWRCTPGCDAASWPACGGATSTSKTARSPSPNNAPPPTT